MIPPRLLLLSGVLCLALGSPAPTGDYETDNTKDHKRDRDSTLRLVTVVMRHGERAPQDTYPNDPYLNNTMEPYGWGQLTNEGRRSQYNQGRFLRDRYDEFLGSIYSPDIFYLQCTAVDRTKMSALLEAAALWKPNEKQSFKSDLPWQPVTLYYQPRSEDTLMLIWDTCPRYTKLRQIIMSSPDVQTVQNDNRQLYEELTNLTGMAISKPDDVNSLYATLTAELQMNLTLPEWTKDYYPDKLVPLTLYDFQLNVYNDALKRLKGGPFLKKIATDMLAKRDNILEPEARKMFMYIGHDSTVATLLDVMDVWNNQMPYYNIMTMIELHEDRDGWNVQEFCYRKILNNEGITATLAEAVFIMALHGEHDFSQPDHLKSGSEEDSVNIRIYLVFLRNTTDHEPYSLTIPGCTTVCPLEKFVQILKPMIPDDWVQECKVEGGYTPPPAPLP